MAEDLGERTEEATPRRRQEARSDGNVAKSQDASSALLLCAGVIVAAAAIMPLLGSFKTMLQDMLAVDVVADPKIGPSIIPSVLHASGVAATVAAPVLLIIWAAAYATQFWQVGWIFSLQQLQPKLSKLNPANGARRIFGASGVIKALMDVMKVALVMVVAVPTIMQRGREIVVLPYLTAMQTWGRIGAMMLDLAIKVLAVLLLLGFIDYIYQRWKYTRDLRMTKQQIRDEMRHTEGDPEVKRRRLRMQQQIAMQRINSAVPKADVIVTNPEHISIAIQYNVDEMAAPKVVAKGADYIALRIRQIAMKHGIPIIERPPLARALYAQVNVNQEIPPAFYQAVAEILAYVYRLSGRMAG